MRFLLLLLLCPTIALAKDQPTYQDGTLVSAHMQQAGSHCAQNASTNGTVRANTDAAGNTNGTINSTTTGDSNCRDVERSVFTVKSGDNTLILTPVLSASTGAALGLLGVTHAIPRDSSLAYQLPGTPLKLRSDGKHFFVKVGKKETMFSVIGAE